MKAAIFLILLHLSGGFFYSDFEVNMIGDIVNSFERPTSIFSKVCCNPLKKIKLMTSMENLDKKPFYVRFIDTNAIYKVVNYIYRQHILFLLDINCPSTRDFLEKANSYRLFGFPYRWLIIGKPLNESTAVPSELYNLNLFTDSEVIIAQNNGNGSFKLIMIYRLKPDSEWIIEDYADWTITSRLKKTKLTEQSISIRRKNLRGMKIVTALVFLNNKTIEDPFDLSDVITDAVSKGSIRQIDPIYNYLNATKEFVYSNTWGYYKNRSYEGMLKEMTIGKAELAGTVLIVTEDRLQVVDYLSLPTATSIKFVFREPPLSYQNNLFLLPFKSTVWYCIGIFVIVLILFLYINALWERQKMETDKDIIYRSALYPNISDVTMLVITAISQQGSSMELKGGLGRLVMFLLFLAFLIIYSAYSASIVVLLQSRSNQIRTLSDLLNSKLELGVEEAPYNRYFFSIATEPVRKAIYETKIAPRGSKPNFMSLEEGVKKLQKEPFAFNMNKGTGYRLVDRYFHEHEKCGLQEIAYLHGTETYFTCRKNSAYREIFKVGLFKIQEYGMSNRENRLIYSRKPACIARGGTFGSVNMVDFYPVILMYMYGIILAFGLLLIEILVHRKHLCSQ